MASRPEASPVRAAVLVVLSALFLSCSFDYGQDRIAETEEQPSAIFIDFVHRVVDKGDLILEISSDRASAYTKSRRTELEGVAFTQYSEGGAVAATGKANAATVYTETENAEFRGGVRLESKKEDSVLEAEELTWVNDAKTISGGLERIVSVQRGDGAWVRGAGFQADLLRRSFSFQEATEGRFVTSESGNTAEAGGGTGP